METGNSTNRHARRAQAAMSRKNGKRIAEFMQKQERARARKAKEERRREGEQRATRLYP